MLRRSDVDQQGLLVQEDLTGQFRFKFLRLLVLGSGGNVEDMDFEFQQLLVCGLGILVARTGVVMQEIDQGLVLLIVYFLQFRLISRVFERSSVQLLVSCIDKGDLSSLYSLRWELLVDLSLVLISEGVQKLFLIESIIYVFLLDFSMGMGYLRGSGVIFCSLRVIGKVVFSVGEEKQEDICSGQKGKVVLRQLGVIFIVLGFRILDFQVFRQSFRMVIVEV